ncbi:MAG: lipid-A-disaccharide synthase [Parachlamydia sp.]|jgi:lipid-A-disaccharide synthase|nr:lipid-A-disaccharide synthase [Parachlamydia sp.]
MKKVFIFAGESSGDLHGSHLMQSLKGKMTFEGVGGPLMRKVGMQCLLPMEEFMVMGFTDVFKSFHRLVKSFYKVRDFILSSLPDCVLLIDYPGFNLRLAKALRKKGYKGKIVQYICPTVWAHGKKRIETMASSLDLLLVIFPFEVDCFKHTALKTAYAGNPLLETLQAYPYDPHWKKKLILPDVPFIALFPGSRPGEIKRHAPSFLQAASKLKNKDEKMVFFLSCTHESHASSLIACIEESPLTLGKDVFIVPREYTYEMMQGCEGALAKSGTITLELALHEKPTVVAYQLTKLNYMIAKYLLRLSLPYYCIVNHLAQKKIYPEFMQTKLDAGVLAEEIERQINSKNDVKQACQSIKSKLAGPQIAGQLIGELFT